MIKSHRSIFAVWCCSLRSTCDLVIGLTVNECVSVCVRVCLCCRPGCVWSLWECPAWIRPRGEGTTRPSWSSSSRSSTPESNACPSVTFISKKGAAVSGPPRLTCVFFISVTNNSAQFDFVTCLQVWGQFLQINFTEWDGRQKDCRGFCIILHYFSISQQSLSIF